MFQPLKYYIVMLDMYIKQDVHMTKALFLCTGRWSCANIHGRVGGLCIGQIFIDASQQVGGSDEAIVRSCYGSCANYANR